MNIRNKSTVSFISFTLIFTFLILLLCFFKQGIGRTEKGNYVFSSNGKITVILDAGHGGEDGGASGKNGILEKDLNLSICMKIGKELTDNGVNVLYTRTEDILLYDKSADHANRKKALDLAERVKIAQNTPNCIFVSIHMNSFPETKYSGLQTYYSKNNINSKSLALQIQTAVRSMIQKQNNRKIVKASSNIYVLDRLECPAVLIECGFLSNPEECRLLSTEIYQNQLSEIISQEIKKYVEKYSQTY